MLRALYNSEKWNVNEGSKKMIANYFAIIL